VEEQGEQQRQGEAPAMALPMPGRRPRGRPLRRAVGVDGNQAVLVVAARCGLAGFAQTPGAAGEVIFMHRLCGQNQAVCNETMPFGCRPDDGHFNFGQFFRLTVAFGFRAPASR
jgi:hypothetical protein